MNHIIEVLSVIVIGLIGGIGVGLQGPMSGAMSQQIGPFGSSLIIHLGGTIASTVLVLVSGGINLSQLPSIPKPYFLAGLFGVILYMTFAFTIPRVGATVATALLIVAQLGVGLLLDHFGWMGVAQHSFNLSRLAGMILLIAGAWLVSQ